MIETEEYRHVLSSIYEQCKSSVVISARHATVYYCFICFSSSSIVYFYTHGRILHNTNLERK